MIQEVHKLIGRLDELGYIVEEELATVLLLMMKLEKPLLMEGPPGVGKTEAANILASYLGTDLIRLQCYEGLDVNMSIYEWNYQKQLLSIKINEKNEQSIEETEAHIFGDEFLLKRPLLKAITADKPPVLLIDEVDRADEEFEAFLLELLSDFQISIPEIGTVKAKHKPIVILTSNRTRELSDALKRRCLYYWVDFPDFDKEFRIVKKHNPNVDENILEQLVKFVEYLRTLKLNKQPGISETIDWANALVTLNAESLTKEITDTTLGCLLKNNSDIQTIKTQGTDTILEKVSE